MGADGQASVRFQPRGPRKILLAGIYSLILKKIPLLEVYSYVLSDR